MTSFAMALGLPQSELVKELGHDGSEVIWPELNDPFRRRAFHIQEFIEPCLQRGYALVIVEAGPVLGANTPNGPVFHPIEGGMSRLLSMISSFDGVLICEIRGIMHAVAWDRSKCLDPNGSIYGLNDLAVREFAALIPVRIRAG